MKNFFSYSLIIFLSALFILTGVKEKKIVNTINQLNGNLISNQSDTLTNKLPNGHQFITNFNLSKNKKIKSISQDSSGIMLLLTGKGIIFFDGITEKELFIETHPNVLKKDKQVEQFYTAERKGFGIVKKEKSGNYIYESISEKKVNNENYKNIITGLNKVWFISEHKIVSINPNDYTKNNIEYFNKNEIISGAFEFKGQLFFSIYNSGLHKIENDSVIPLINDSLFSNSEIIFDIPHNKSVILGMADNKLYTFTGKKYKVFKTSSDDYIKESIITGGCNFTDKNLVITTLNGGAILINKETGENTHTINYRTGLPDDEIYAVSTDNHGGLWLSHDYGFSRIAFDIPVTNYGFYPGLEGKINFVKFFDSTLYVATGEGLFRLSETKSYDEVEVATKKWVKSRTKNTSGNYSPATISSQETDESNEETDNSFLNRWKKRRQKKKVEPVVDNSANDIEKKTSSKKTTNSLKSKTDSYKTTYKAVTEYKKIYELHSVKYTYKKIDGITSKCKHLINFSDGLLASTNSGLFYIKNNEVKTLIKDSYIYNISGNTDDKILYSATSSGLFKISINKTNILSEKILAKNIENRTFQKVLKVNDSIVWGSSLNELFLLKIKDSEIYSAEKYNIEADQSEELFMVKENNQIIFLTSGSAYYYNDELNDVIEHSEYYKLLRKSDNMFSVTDTSIFLTENNSILKGINSKTNWNHLKYAWLIDNIESINIDEQDNIWVVSQQNFIYKISNNQSDQERKFEITITDVNDSKGNSFNTFNTLELESGYKNIFVQLSSPCYLKKDFVKFSYGIDNQNHEEFIDFSSSRIQISELTAGKHIIYFQATNDLNEKSETLKIKLNIKPPFWETNAFIISVFLIVLILISIIISAFYRRKQRKIKEYNEILELKVKERTVEIEKQNKKIQNQNTEIYDQYQKINLQNEEITGSIRYAGKIQRAVLPNIDIHKKYLSGFFNLYKPRDIVSGDFYWVNEAQNKLFIAAVDCTGHGVPGGFLSMLGISFLNEIIIDLNRKKKYIRAADVLNILREKIIATLSQQGDAITQDGMDISLVVIDKDKKILNFAGANNPAYIIRNNTLTKIDADRMPIGYNKKLNDIKFKDKFIKILKDDTIYIFSDGYADQFGGSHGKKFNARRFRELLLHIQKSPITKQKDIADNILQKWKQEHDQVDDILLIGMKI